MNQSLRIEMKIIKNNNEYVFSVPYGVAYGEAFEVINEFAHHVVESSKEAEKQAQEIEKGKEEDHGSK